MFFGRKAVIVRGLDTLRTLRDQGVERMMVILGASGSGKSSFLRAGLWPRLERDDLNFLPLPVIRPERAVISGASGLVACLDVAFRVHNLPKSRAKIRTELKESGGLAQLLGELQELACSRLVSDTPLPTVVICVDQGEELLSAEGITEAEAFLTMLAETLRPARNGTLKVIDARRLTLAVIAIRSDSYERLQTEPNLQDIAPHLFNLAPIPQTEFKTIIEGPPARATAAGQKLVIQPALTERLLIDTEGPDALPLLAFTLERLFLEHSGDSEMNLDDYEELGGVRGSIEAAVEAAFLEHERIPTVPPGKAEREKLLRKAFVPWLAEVDPQTEERKRRVACWDELPTETHPLMERMIAARLLVKDRRKLVESKEEAVVVEVAHEALLRQWPSLAVWLNDDADALKALDAVRRASAEWVKNEKGEAWLVHTGERLTTEEDIKKRPDFHRLLGDNGTDYLQACRQHDDEARKEREAQTKRVARFQRRIAALLALIAIVLAGAGSWITMQSRAVGRQTSLVLATSAEKAKQNKMYDRALRYAIIGMQSTWLSPTVPEAEAELASAAHLSRLRAKLDGHKQSVLSAVFSADGQRVVTVSADKTALVWDATSGRQIVRLDGHDCSVLSASFSPDGQRVVTASQDNTARVWDVASGSLIARLDGNRDSFGSPSKFIGGTGPGAIISYSDGTQRKLDDSSKKHSLLLGYPSVSSAFFSPDGQRVVTAGGRAARVWDAINGIEISRLDGHDWEVLSAVFSPDGQRVVTASADKTTRVWDAASGKQITRLAGHEDWVRSAFFSPDGQRVVTASLDKTARVWDPVTGKEIARLSGHESGVRSAVFSPDGQRVVTASDDKTARVWDPATGKEIARLSGHEGVVRSAVFSPDGQRVVTASDDKTARVWDPTTGKEIARLSGHEGVVRSAVFSPDGQRVVTASYDKTARIWDAICDKTTARLCCHADMIKTAVFSPNGQWVVTASWDKTALIWDAATGKEVAQLEGHGDWVWSAFFSPAGGRVVTASQDGTARVWDPATGKEIACLSGHRSGVRSAVFSPNGQRVVTASWDKTARVWDPVTGKEIARLSGHEGVVRSAVFSPDGQRVVTASGDKTARVWDPATGKEIACLIGHEDVVRSAVFSSDGQRVVTASWDKTARVWDPATGKQISRLDGHEDYIWSAVFSPDGRQVVTASRDGTAQVWDTASGNLIARLDGHNDSVSSAIFSPDGQRVLTASEDKTTRVWDVTSRRQIAQFRGHKDKVYSAVFSPDGQRVVTASDDKTARVWDVNWLTQFHGYELVTAVCREKLTGASKLSVEDIRNSPMLRGRVGEDVCTNLPVLSRIWRVAAGFLSGERDEKIAE